MSPNEFSANVTGMLQKLADFLFGKAPDIFDADGNVVHKFTPKKWQDWDDRFRASRDYDWRKHKGTEKKIAERKPVSAPPANPANPGAPAAKKA